MVHLGDLRKGITVQGGHIPVYIPKGKPADLTKVHPPQQPSAAQPPPGTVRLEEFSDALAVGFGHMTPEQLGAHRAQRVYYNIMADDQLWTNMEVRVGDISMLLEALTSIYAAYEIAFTAIQVRRSTIHQETR